MASLPQTIDLAAIRRAMPATARVAYLNTGTTGPLPLPAIQAAAAASESEAYEGRLNRAAAEASRQEQAQLRAALARFVGAEASEIGLTHNTTEGVNVGVWGVDWKAGDVAVTTTLEHPGGLLPLYQAHSRYGAQVVFANVGRGERDQALRAMTEAIRPGVKMVVLSHVAWSTGAILPLAEIVDVAHRVGALVCVDGAQSVGAIPVSMKDLGVDVYGFPGQKWLCGPEGTGGVFVRQDRLDTIQPTFVGFRGNDHERYSPTDVESLAFVPSAQRYEVASQNKPSLSGLKASVEWLAGRGPIFEAIERNARYCLSRVSQLRGVEVLTPDSDRLSGLVAFRLDGVDVTACVSHLAEQSVAIRSIPDNQALRISCGFFNTTDEIDLAINLIDEFRRR